MPRGAHTISKRVEPGSPHQPPSPPPPPGGRELKTLLLIVGGILLLTLLFSGGRRLPPPPTPPQFHFGVIEARNFSPGTPISLVLDCTAYEFAYLTAESVSAALRETPSDKVFSLDFNTGKSTGTAESSDVLVLVGDLRLRIGKLAQRDNLHAEVRSFGKDIAAYYNYSRSPRGPPESKTAATRKLIYVVGTLDDVSFDGMRDRSIATLSAIDFAPPPERVYEYFEAWESYRREVREAIRRNTKYRPVR